MPLKSLSKIVRSLWLMISRLLVINWLSFGNLPESALTIREAIEKWPTAPHVSGWSRFQSRTRSTPSKLQTVLRQVASAYVCGCPDPGDPSTCAPHCMAKGKSAGFCASLLSLGTFLPFLCTLGSSSHSVPESPACVTNGVVSSEALCAYSVVLRGPMKTSATYSKPPWDL